MLELQEHPRQRLFRTLAPRLSSCWVLVSWFMLRSTSRGARRSRFKAISRPSLELPGSNRSTKPSSCNRRLAATPLLLVSRFSAQLRRSNWAGRAGRQRSWQSLRSSTCSLSLRCLSKSLRDAGSAPGSSKSASFATRHLPKPSHSGFPRKESSVSSGQASTATQQRLPPWHVHAQQGLKGIEVQVVQMEDSALELLNLSCWPIYASNTFRTAS